MKYVHKCVQILDNYKLANSNNQVGILYLMIFGSWYHQPTIYLPVLAVPTLAWVAMEFSWGFSEA